MRHPHSLLGQWKRDNTKISPAVATVIQAILEVGNGLPVRFLSGYESSMEAAIIAGVVRIKEDCVFLTIKGNRLLQTLITLAKEDGVI